MNAYPRFTQTADYPWGSDVGQLDMIVERTRRTWGKGMLLRQFAPSLLTDATLVDLESRYERQAASPGTAIAMTRMINLMDDMRMGDQQPLEGFLGRAVPEMGHPK